MATWLKIYELVCCLWCARYVSKCFTQINPFNPLNNLWNRYCHHPHFTGKETEAQLRTLCLVMDLAPCHSASACYSQDLNQSGCRIEVLRLPLRSITLASLKSAKQQAISMIMFHFTFSEYSISEVFTVWNQWGFWAVKWTPLSVTLRSLCSCLKKAWVYPSHHIPE